MKTKQIDLEIERLTMLKNRSELTETGLELLNELIKVKEQLKLHGVSKSLPERKGRCCGRCDGVHDLCFSDMTCDEHNVLGCEDCYGER